MDSRAHIVEIPLKGEILSSFCRRGRRRLRDAEAACGVKLRLDRARGVIVAAGPPESTAGLRKYLAGLIGRRRSVPLAVWAELMRTRTFTDSEDATMLRLQEQCGCRIHIERGQPEVCIFGEDEGADKADLLLAELETQVAQETLVVENIAELSPVSLQQLAHRCRVTLRVEASQLLVVGLKGRLAEAIDEVRRYVDDPSRCDTFPSEAAASIQQEDASSVSSALGSTGLWDPSAAPDAKSLAPKHPIGHQQLSASDGGAQGQAAACPTCGCGRFCAHCGTQVWQLVPMEMVQPMPYVASGQPHLAGAQTPGSAQSGEAPGSQDDAPSPCWADHCAGQTAYVPVYFVPAMMQGGPGGARMGMMPAPRVGGCYTQPMFAQGFPVPAAAA